jgi:2-desacetyl-2-hydroxyethyl bacteriochlorophyllide A dehydrogenase
VRAFVINGPREATVQHVPEPGATEDQVVVEVVLAGVCGTDVEFFTGSMPYLHDGQASYPIRIGHEWCGHVVEVGADVEDAWLGAFVTGDTMLGCGRCERCRSGRHHVCADRYEVGVRGGWNGALAERLLIPAAALKRLPDSMPPRTAALVEPAGSALRAVEAGAVAEGSRVCVWGAGTIGLLALQFARAEGGAVDVVDPKPSARRLAHQLGARSTSEPEHAPERGFDVVIDASTSQDVPARIVEQVEPSGRVVLIGVAPEPSRVDTRRITLRDITVVGVLSASAALERAIGQLASGKIEADPLIGAVVTLDDVADVLAGHDHRPTVGPKTLVDPSR